MLDSSCGYGNQDTYFANFHNSDSYPIDIIFLKSHERTEQLYKSNLAPGENYVQEAYFNHQWMFKRTSSNHYLIAKANGIESDVFEGCQFEAKRNEYLVVTIFSGNENKGMLKLSMVSIILLV